MTWIDCGPEHLEDIRAIFNEAIANSTALYEDDPRSVEVMAAWWKTKQEKNLPVIGVIDEAGALMGFASYGPFRPFPGYRHTVEHSVYVNSHFRGRGLGSQLLERITLRAQEQGYHGMIGVIDADNKLSIALHERQGFTQCAHIQQVGFKFGRWLDVVMYQKLLQ